MQTETEDRVAFDKRFYVMSQFQKYTSTFSLKCKESDENTDATLPAAAN